MIIMIERTSSKMYFKILVIVSILTVMIIVNTFSCPLYPMMVFRNFFPQGFSIFGHVLSIVKKDVHDTQMFFL